ncbi:MAG: APC family permease [Nitrososphaerales archaeon]
MSDESSGLRRAIKLRNAVALYASSVLGSGILVLPGLAAQIAGPGSILAWVLLSMASYPFAFTFATLSARRPESGGVYSFAKEAFGLRVATVTGWLFALWVITGAPAVALIAASYLGYAFPLDRLETFVIASGIIVAAFIVNYRGIVISNKIQLATIGSIIALLLAAIVFSSFSVKLQNFSPFLPNGLLPVGTAAALIFWSYLGYENVSNVAEEFENPQRDFHRSIILSVVLIGILYASVAFVTIGTDAYRAGGNIAPFAVILSNVVGKYGAAGTALLALFIIFGTVNAYTTGMSRVFYAVSRDGGFPRALDHLNEKTKVPDRALISLFGCTIPVLVVYYFFHVNLETALLIPSGAAILIYVIGSAAGVKMLGVASEETGISRIRKRMFLPLISLGISLIVLPFVGWLLAVSLAVSLAALIYTRIHFSGQKLQNVPE